MQRVIIGCGTGRCGTVSLAVLLQAQEGVYATHERDPVLPWRIDLRLFSIRLAQFRQCDEPFVADVAFYYLPYIPYLLREFSDLRVIVLRRDKKETVRSFLAKLGRRHHFLEAPQEWGYQADPKWDPCFPKYPPMDLEAALHLYWEEYYWIADEYARKWPENIRIFEIDALNSERGQCEILKFTGIPEPHKHILPIRFNVGPYGYREIPKEVKEGHIT